MRQDHKHCDVAGKASLVAALVQLVNLPAALISWLAPRSGVHNR